MTYEKFHNRVAIEAKLVAVTPIFIGAREDSFKPGTINGSCVKDTQGRPYIPGSSLKGVMRAFLSGIEPIDVEKRREDGETEKSCADTPSKERRADAPNGKQRPDKTTADFRIKEQRDDAVREAIKNAGDKYKNKKIDEIRDEILAELITAASTPVERLFGSEVMAGKVKIADAFPYANSITPEIRNGVAIDRSTRTARGGALFDTEVVPSGTEFRFIASAENLSEYEAELFGKLIEFFADGNITVGGRSRAGLGNIELCDVKLTVYRGAPGEFPMPIEVDINDNHNGRKSIWEEMCKCLKN